MWLFLLGCDGNGGRGQVGLAHDRIDGNVLARRIHVRRMEEDDGVLRCEGLGVDDEVHEVPLGPAVADQELLLAGLLAETTYRCEVPGQDSEVLEFTTEALPDDVPRADLVEDGEPGGGYVILNHGTDDKEDRQTKILIYDDRGRLRWYNFVPIAAPDLDVSYLGGGVILYGGGYRALPTLIDLEGRVLQQAPGPFEPGGQFNHTVEELPDGNYLTTETSPNFDPALPSHKWNGFAVELLDPTMSARPWVLRSQDLVDVGEMYIPVNPEDKDPYHLNALQWLPEDGQVAASLYRRAEIVWFDLAEKRVVDRVGWRSDWTVVDEAGDELPGEEWFYGQHAVELDGDRMLLHDNGAGRPSATRYSRAVDYRLDPVAKTATRVWSWTEPGWYEPIWGDVDRLEDGRVSITHAHCEKCSDVSGQRTEVILVDPDTDAVDWRLRFSSPSDAGYRSAWLDGCRIFHRTSACD
jgi:hypothetical protein